MNTKIFAMFATILMLGTLAMPVVAAQNSQKTSYIYDAEKSMN